ncbi:hypothetical protein [Paracoccus sp. (in: a-proteobacteria)]|uniref:ExbD/TolR family protein n=1 Tax=Paracoccus sp. TaxID=267 RepID=UPI0028985307|nr:hypothetical protein [Paracoccus sp. (in: a-proteobacteria)]
MSMNLPARRRLRGIDVSLAIVNIVLLLIFFFVAAGQDSLDTAGIDLATTADLPFDRLPKPIVSVDPQGNWRLDGAEITAETLPVALADRPEGSDLFLIVDRAAPASQLIALLNLPELRPYRLRLVTLRQSALP